MSIDHLQPDSKSPAMRKLEAFLERGGGAENNLSIGDAWTETNGILSLTKARERILGITTSDQPPVTIGVQIERHTTYNYDPGRDDLNIEESDWIISSTAAVECAMDMCACMQTEMRSDAEETEREASLEAEVSQTMRDWSGEPYRSLLAEHVDEESIEAFISELRRIFETRMLDWLKNHHTAP